MKWRCWMTWGPGWRTVYTTLWDTKVCKVFLFRFQLRALFCFILFCLKCYLSLMSNMKKKKIFKDDYLFPYRSFSWDQKLESRDCISHSLMWPWSIMRSVTVCAKETQAGNCILHSSALPHWHPGSPTSIPHPHQHLPQGCQMPRLAVIKTILIVPIQNLSCLLQRPSVCRTG